MFFFFVFGWSMNVDVSSSQWELCTKVLNKGNWTCLGFLKTHFTSSPKDQFHWLVVVAATSDLESATLRQADRIKSLHSTQVILTDEAFQMRSKTASWHISKSSRLRSALRFCLTWLDDWGSPCCYCVNRQGRISITPVVATTARCAVQVSQFFSVCHLALTHCF